MSATVHQLVPRQDGPEPYLSRTEAAKLMGVSERTIDRWCLEGAPHETWGMRTKKLRLSSLEAWARRRAS